MTLKRMGYNLKTRAGVVAKQSILQACGRTISPSGWLTDVSELTVLLSRVAPRATNHELVRVGSEGDGGYLIPDDLSGVSTCFSPGVSNVADFEANLVGRGIRCYLADNSVDAAPFSHSLVDFRQTYIGGVKDAKTVTLEEWVNDCVSSDDREMILQMDIEGAEYEVLLAASRDLLDRFRIIVIEMHHLDQLVTRSGFLVIGGALNKLLETFVCVHIHPNNFHDPIRWEDLVLPPVMEFTFHRRDRIARVLGGESLPNPSDRPNCRWRSEQSLPSCWQRHRSGC